MITPSMDTRSRRKQAAFRRDVVMVGPSMNTDLDRPVSPIGHLGDRSVSTTP